MKSGQLTNCERGQTPPNVKDGGAGNVSGGALILDSTYGFRFRVVKRRPSRVLLVENDKAIADVLRLALLTCGFKVDLACDGQEGIDSILRGQLPDVVVLDLGMPRPEKDMPRKDGMDMLSTLRSIRLTQQVPVLALAGDIQSLDDAYDRGASDCMVNWRTKPSDLTRKVSALLSPRYW